MARLWQTLKQQAGRDDIPYPSSNPLTKTGRKVMASMMKEYGKKKGRQVFYATARKYNKRWEEK